MDRPEIIKDVAAQRIYFQATEGRPSATPVIGVKSNGADVLTTSTATYTTQNSVNTTIANSAAKGATEVVVTSATGILVGNSYRLVSKQSQVEWVQVASINSTTIGLKRPLEYAFSTLSTTYGDFESCDFYYTVQEADYDTLRELCVCSASYAVGGLTHYIRRPFDVVTNPLDNPLTMKAVYQRWPDIARQEPPEQRGEDFLPQRNAAWDMVKRRIRQMSASDKTQWRPALVVDVSDLFETGMKQLALILHEMGIEVIRTRPVPTWDELVKRVEEEWMRASRTLSWLDLEDDASLGEGEDQPMVMDFIR